MKQRYFTKPTSAKKYDPDDAFTQLKVFLPKATLDILRHASEKTGLAMSRLCAIAVDNELDVAEPFYYPFEIPTTPYIDYEFSEAAGRLLRFLEKFPEGTQVETVPLCRREYGVDTREEAAGGNRELLTQGVIEEFTLARSPNVVRVRVVGVSEKKLRGKKFSRIEGVSTKYVRPVTDEDIER